MKISFDEILPPNVLLYAGTQNSSNISILGVVLDQNVLFRPLTLKITVKEYISKVTISKASSGWKTENVELSHVQIGHTVWAVGPLKKKKKKKKSMYLQFQC
jgi:hypothetical protein